MFPAGVDNPMGASPRSLLDSRGSISEAELCLIQIKRNRSFTHAPAPGAAAAARVISSGCAPVLDPGRAEKNLLPG